MLLTLFRRIYLPGCTIGSYRLGAAQYWTLEPEWYGGEQEGSCIPEGDYMLSRYFSPTKGWVLRLGKVEGRDGIEIHAGNFRRDTRGCILVGKDFTANPVNSCVEQSHAALAALLAYESANGPLKLRIVNFHWLT